MSLKVAALQTDPTLGTSSTVGRYFGIVSAVPSFILSVWIYLLLAVRPFSGDPDLEALKTDNPVDRPAHAVGLVVAALVIAVVSHPLQTTAVQVLEGYWGFSNVARRAAKNRVITHLRRRSAATEVFNKQGRRLDRFMAQDDGRWTDHLTGKPLAEHPHTAEDFVGANVDTATATAALNAYPVELHHTMPTRLGNILRRHEALAGKAIGLDVLTWANHVGLVAEPAHTAYVQDQRNQLDLAVRMTTASMVAAGATFLVMWPHGLWLLTALLPISAAWLSYRGALVAADGYGIAFTAWLHLNRFRLYEQLNLRPVANPQQERAQNAHLADLILGKPTYNLPYRQRPPTGTETPS